MELKQGENFLFFRKAFASGPGAEMMGLQGSAVCTKDFIFFVKDERKSMDKQFMKSLTFGAVNEGDDTPTMLSKMVTAPDATIEGMENFLTDFLTKRGDAHYVYKVEELQQFKNKTGLFGHTRVQRQGLPFVALSMKGTKGAKKMMHDFYGC